VNYRRAYGECLGVRRR